MLGTGSANRATVSMLSVNAENTVRNLFEVKPPSIQCRVDYCFPTALLSPSANAI